MVFAIMFFQYASRNWEDEDQQTTLNHQSNLHYHYCLGMFYQLTVSHTFEDCQALGLICAHLRNFPKPGASWVLTSTTLDLAVELGLYRSVKSRPPTDRTLNPLEVEMRKRTFWCILAIHVTLSGKLGRPVQIRMDDLDIEIPEPVDDDLLSEAGLDTSRPGNCAHRIGLAALNLLPVFMELFATIYAVRRNPEDYVDNVNTLEARLRSWIAQTPDDLLKGTAGEDQQEGRVFSLYTQTWVCEIRMLLYHPSTSLSLDPAFNAKSMEVCVESARKMLECVVQLQKLKSLDTTWYQSAVYVMAITTTLFAQWEKRNDMTPKDLADLRKEMDVWLDVMSDVGLLLGSGTRLRDAVKNVTDGTLGMLSHSLLAKSGFASQQQIINGQEVATKTPPQRAVSGSVNNTASSASNNGFPAAVYGDASPSLHDNSVSTAFVSPESAITHQQTPYPPATQYSAYTDSTPSNTTNISYTPTTTHHHSSFSYSTGTNESVEAPLLAAFANQASQAAAQSWERPSSQRASNAGIMNSNHGSQSWQQWTSTVAGNLEPQDCYSASALMQLGGRDLDGNHAGMNTVSHAAGSSAPLADIGGAHAAVMAVTHIQGDDAHAHALAAANGIAWPLNIFDIPQQHGQ